MAIYQKCLKNTKNGKTVRNKAQEKWKEKQRKVVMSKKHQETTQ